VTIVQPHPVTETGGNYEPFHRLKVSIDYTTKVDSFILTVNTVSLEQWVTTVISYIL